MDSTRTSLAVALAEAARMIDGSSSVEDTLAAIAAAAAVSVPDIDQVGISVIHRGGEIETRAATGQLVWDLDGLQYELGEGPCVSAMLDEPVVVVDDIRNDQRWPRFAPRAAAAGLRAQMAVRLYHEDSTIGALNMYATEATTIHRDAPEAAELFAAHAALALGRARREEQLHEALQTRKLIGQAIGVLMERYGIDEDRAFGFLVRASSTSNVKLREVAREVVDRTNQGRRGATS
ncbi:ANTAR domain-containing protein [Nocardioides sp. Soil805]|uniref:ANTAR domain-containing protein n=1 Tax=Nocardioides sp. Soil805 TaxID=1736416 RepID=UPI000A7D976B|nr:ANTAR domain-containing protein [Nocardioides sp. Soil805]